MTPSSDTLANTNSSRTLFAVQMKDANWQSGDLGWSREAARILPAILDAVVTQSGWHASGREGEICLVFTNDAEVQQLNKSWRGKDAPTNVLSFPCGEEEGPDDPVLGDVVFAFETITREARDQGKTFRNHATHLIVHGVLHLLGYDHQTGVEADEMEDLERVVLASLEIADPYQSHPG